MSFQTGKTPKTDKKAEYILKEFGPNNNGRFAAMADFAREQERQLNKIAELTLQLQDSPKSLLHHLTEFAKTHVQGLEEKKTEKQEKE